MIIKRAAQNIFSVIDDDGVLIGNIALDDDGSWRAGISGARMSFPSIDLAARYVRSATGVSVSADTPDPMTDDELAALQEATTLATDRLNARMGMDGGEIALPSVNIGAPPQPSEDP